MGDTMNIESELKQYFKKDVSYTLFTVLLAFFAVSFIFKVCYVAGCGLIPYWTELVPQVEVYFGAIMGILILGIIFTEKILK